MALDLFSFTATKGAEDSSSASGCTPEVRLEQVPKASLELNMCMAMVPTEYRTATAMIEFGAFSTMLLSIS